MKVHSIDRDTLALLLEMGKSSYPNEYMVLLGAENGVIMPSDTDYATFAEMGQVHIIVGEPFDEYSWRAFSRDGTRVKLDIV